MAAAKKLLTDEEKVREILVKARRALSEKGALPAARLGAAGIRSNVIERLRGEGYEATPKGVRVPLVAQGEKILEAGAHVALSTWTKRLAGASKAEADHLARELCKDGKAHLVLRGKQLSLVPGTEAVVERRVLSDVQTDLRRALDWIKKASAGKSLATVLVSDLREAIDEVSRRIRDQEAPKRKPPSPASDANGGSLGRALRGVVLATRDEESLLASVPEVSRRLREQATVEQVQDELLSAHRRGELELRPEGGIGRLTAADAALCPVGAGGVRLSWVRLLEVSP